MLSNWVFFTIKNVKFGGFFYKGEKIRPMKTLNVDAIFRFNQMLKTRNLAFWYEKLNTAPNLTRPNVSDVSNWVEESRMYGIVQPIRVAQSLWRIITARTWTEINIHWVGHTHDLSFARSLSLPPFLDVLKSSLPHLSCPLPPLSRERNSCAYDSVHSKKLMCLTLERARDLSFFGSTSMIWFVSSPTWDCGRL